MMRRDRKDEPLFIMHISLKKRLKSPFHSNFPEKYAFHDHYCILIVSIMLIA